MPLADAPDEGPQPDLDARERWLEERQALLDDARRPRVVAATRLAHDDADAATEKPEPSDDEHSPWRRGRAGTAVGRAVHAVLQTIDHVSLDGLADAARAQASAEGVPDREAEIARLVRAACASQPVRAAAASGRSWRELYVAAPVATPAGDVLLEGFVDLLYKTAEGYVVVDYKTDGVSSETQIDRAMQQYRVQGAAYALALEQQLGQPVVSFECVFVTPERVRSVAGEELRTAMDEARRRLASMRGRAPDEASLAPVG
jgi:ATP-dependent helicase/nuclease subunit A